MTVSIEEGDDEEEMIELVRNTTKEIMEENELLTDENPTVKKVKFLEEEEEEEEIVIPPFLESPVAEDSDQMPLILGVSLGLLALLLGGAFLKKKKFGNTTDRSLVVPPAKSNTSSSFVAPSVGNLGKHTSCMDVHECKSAFCPKCYVDRSIMFVDAPKIPMSVPDDNKARVFDETPVEQGWHNVQLGSSSFESSSTTEFY